MSEPDPWELTDVVTRLRRVLRASIRSEIAWEQLPMAQVELLQRLADEPALRVRQLAERHRLAANTVSGLVQQMLEAGLVTRDPDPSDRRAVTVSLTGDGEQALTRWRSAHQRRLAAALEGLTGEQRRSIHGALPALVALVERLDEQ